MEGSFENSTLFGHNHFNFRFKQQFRIYTFKYLQVSKRFQYFLLIRLKSTSFFSNYHTETVVSIDVNKNEPNLFVSSSVDRKVCLWDDRTADFASGICIYILRKTCNRFVRFIYAVLYQNEFSTMTTVCHHPAYSNIIAAGSDAGDIYLLDKREPKQFVTVYNCFDSSIHRAKFDDSNKLAICGDTKDLLVLNCSENNLKPLYISQEHEDIVRGLAWWEGDLYSCGYDGKCLKHSV